MTSCLFCKIINDDIPSTKVYENDNVYAFTDIAPQAPVHILVVPKIHTENVEQAGAHSGMYEECLKACTEVARITGVDQSGYRIVTNSGTHGCQSVSHLHFHVIGGRQLSGEMA